MPWPAPALIERMRQPLVDPEQAVDALVLVAAWSRRVPGAWKPSRSASLSSTASPVTFAPAGPISSASGRWLKAFRNR